MKLEEHRMHYRGFLRHKSINNKKIDDLQEKPISVQKKGDKMSLRQ